MTKIIFPTAKTLIAVAALAVAPSIAASIAHAASPDAYEVTKTMVRVDDLNLATASGKATLEARIASAVTRVCGAPGDRLELQNRQAVNHCRAKARHDALASARISETEVLAAR